METASVLVRFLFQIWMVVTVFMFAYLFITSVMTFASVVSYQEFSCGFRWAWAGHINFWWTSYCVRSIKDHIIELLCPLGIIYHFVTPFTITTLRWLICCLMDYNRASVLDYLVHRVQCLGLFSTHYHKLAVEHEDDKVKSPYHALNWIQPYTGVNLCIWIPHIVGITLPYGMPSRHWRRRFGRGDFPLQINSWFMSQKLWLECCSISRLFPSQYYCFLNAFTQIWMLFLPEAPLS